MAQGDLYRLLKRISNNLERESKRENLKKITHDVLLDREELIKEMLLQIQDFKAASQLPRTEKGKLQQAFRRQYGSAAGNTRAQAISGLNSRANTEGLSSATIKAVEFEAKRILTSARSLASSGKATSTVSVKKISGDGVNSLVLRFTPKRSGVNDTYDAINTTIVVPIKTNMSRLVKQILSLDDKDTKDVQTRFFNVGHVRAVSEVKAATQLEILVRNTDKIKSRYSDEDSKAAADVVRLSILSKFSQFGDPEVRKEFLAKIAIVKPESESANQTDSVYEAALLNDMKRAFSKALLDMPNDWSKQRTSDSIVDIAIKEIVETVQKRGTKLKNAPSTKKKTTSSNASIDLKIPKAKTTSSNISSKVTPGKLPLPARARRTAVSLQILVPLINQKLPEVIRSHMGSNGRLVNRTGRFSESAQVIGADNFGLTYTYQKDPYATFESQGARDPRPLIEQSIREIAIQQMSAKFDLRSV